MPVGELASAVRSTMTGSRSAVDAAIAAHPYRLECWAFGGTSVGTVDGKPRTCADCRRRTRDPIGYGDDVFRCPRCAFTIHVCPLPGVGIADASA